MSEYDHMMRGGKVGTGAPASAQYEAIDRRERLRRMALETINIDKDPYFMKNHLGSYECKLCLTLHNNEGNYLAHTQGKRHQQNLARRAAKEALDKPEEPQPKTISRGVRKVVKIGRPGYRVTKQRDPATAQRSLLFQIEYPEIEDGLQPRHRFMSAYEQRVEAADKNYQYLLFAADPYETISFKVPNREIDKGEGKFYSNWDTAKKAFTVQLHFKDKMIGGGGIGMGGGLTPNMPPPPPPGAAFDSQSALSNPNIANIGFTKFHQ